mmetsp:Transcript_27124/g.41281  ORF Transcript_27124/g.41281 Transcript_27124/m.41281 type:complete len:177 (-) Transcript_27124:734-1264(-)|eukprot:CAMPEP_0170482160 /NCGR_PEP_ID=MMETSP0208-20121228/2304_1 /TAXON_ID=197538 /ORGANISM="Strombidium inclinatum, Strain S3" /LENGTH=176 /DNA_ID=CAMNT_0010754967 /DNA_START=852 /DNA_END=1382 /DNA_ORIENTATION=+
MQQNRLPEESARFYAAELVVFLERAHLKEKIIHRRLSPSNCFIFSNLHLKVGNFWFAKNFADPKTNVIESGSKQDKILPSLNQGLRYIAPEYIEERLDSPSLDLWALGCIIFEMITGQVPFEGTTEAQLIHNILERNIKWELLNEVKNLAPLKDLLEKLLHLEPSMRLGAGKAGSK